MASRLTIAHLIQQVKCETRHLSLSWGLCCWSGHSSLCNLHVQLVKKTMKNLRISVSIVCICSQHGLDTTLVILVARVKFQSSLQWDEYKTHHRRPIYSSNWVIYGCLSLDLPRLYRKDILIVLAKGGFRWTLWLTPTSLRQQRHIATTIRFLMLLAARICLVSGNWQSGEQ